MKDLIFEHELQSTPTRVQAGVYAGGGKRLFDIFLAILLVPVLVPVIAVCWAFVRRDGGAGFYSQLRVGKDGKTFRCWKLRSMVMDADQALKDMCDGDPEVAREWHVNQKLENDPRITRVGRFLRSTSLDELPQLWNVCKGDMSFVGPRPFLPDQKSLYDAAGEQHYYYDMRPGVTGLWQVEGRSKTSFLDRIRYDDRYGQSMSLGADLRLIWKTVAVVLNRTGH